MSSLPSLYVAGPMSGYPAYNYPAFHSAAAKLRDLGYHVENPAENGEQADWAGYMRAAIAQVIRADGIATLPNWQQSRGAALEVHIAHALQMPVLPVERWIADVEVAA